LANTNLEGLNAVFVSKVRRVLDCLKKRWQPVVASGLRSESEQREKVALGYSLTMNSKHRIGNAADIIDR